ncbi:MAG: tannase/feruloyl esterase family alpha/beta hydrolase [Thermocrispum sp.]
MSHRRTRALVAALAVCGLLPLTVVPAAATEDCARLHRLSVPGASHQEASCLSGLTTASTVASGHTNPEDYAGLTTADTPQPRGVPGIQVDGYFPDRTTSNTNNGWNHDAQFVLRLPDRWNGGLIVAGAPGNRRQYANDRAIADQVLAMGYAYAATDKGNTGLGFYHGQRYPGEAIAEWHRRLTQLTVAAKRVVRQRYGRPPARTFATGISNGGYLVRWQLENRPWLYDGGVDWEGTLWTARGPNLFTFLPPALRHYPDYVAGEPGARQALLDAGFAPGSEFLWDYHYRVYWDLTQRIYREALDPGFDGELDAGVPFCRSGTPHCDADYDYASRPQAQAAVRRIAVTGRIGKPMITLHGTLDTLLPIGVDSDVYAKMVRQQGREWLHSYRRIEAGNHVDGLVDVHPERLRAIGPHFVAAVRELARRTG